MKRAYVIGWALLVAGAVTFAAEPPPIPVDETDMGLRFDPASLDLTGGPAKVTVLLDFGGTEAYGVQGWSLGICHDKAKANVTEAVLGEDALVAKDGELPDFRKINILEDGVTCGIVVDFGMTGTMFKVPAPQAGFKALDITYECVGGENSTIMSCDVLGDPAVLPVVVVEGVSLAFGGTVENGTLVCETVIPTEKTKLFLQSSEDNVASVMVLTNQKRVDAVSLGVSHTGNFTLQSIEKGAAVADKDLFFWGPRTVAGGGTVALVMPIDPVDEPLPTSDTAAEVARLIYCYPSDGAAGATDVQITDTLGDPPVDVVVNSPDVQPSGGPLGPDDLEVDTAAVSVNVAQTCVGERFVRADANQDAQVNISDGVFIARHVFGLIPDPGCADAIDANDDGVLDTSDPIYLLNYLFLGGSVVPAPFSAANLRNITAADCDVDPTADALACPTYAPCP